MTIVNPLVRFFSSDRTDSNGSINHSYEEYVESKGEEDTPFPTPHTIMDMNKDQLIAYAMDMYGLKYNKGMLASNMVKGMYEQQNGIEVQNRGRKKRENILTPKDNTHEAQDDI